MMGSFCSTKLTDPLAYIMWAVTEAGIDAGKLEKELEHLNKLAEQGHSYVVALAAIVNKRLKKNEQAKKLGDKLVSLQDKQGSVTNPGSTIVYSVSLLHMFP